MHCLQMIHSFLFLPTLIFPVDCLRLILVFNLFLKFKTLAFFIFFDVLVSDHNHQFPMFISENSSHSLSPHAFSNHPSQYKMVAFYTHVCHALHICSNSS